MFGVLLTLPAAAQGDTSTPVDLAVVLPAPQTVGAGEPFLFEPSVGINADLPEQTIYPLPPWSLTWAIDFPPGIKLISGRWPGSVTPQLLNCVSNCPYVMNEPSAAGYAYQLVAAAPGQYQISAQITQTSNPDPDLSNNTATVQVSVVPLRIKLASESASAARAGKQLTWTVAATSISSSAWFLADRATCSGRLGAKAVAGKVSRITGKIVCRWPLPATAAGKTFVASVHASLAAANASLSRSFRVVR